MIDFTGPQRVLEDPEPASATPRSRRRVGWRKGSEVDEEMWPAEAFGGVSDEQFWDDLAADKPLATTARTAQPDTAAKRRPPTGAGPGAHPQPRLGPDDRTAAQPAQPAQPVRAAHQPAESRGRSRASADDDPLTSPAYSLRPRGSVDGRAYPSSRRSSDLTRGQHEAAAGQETQAFSLADAQAAGGGYPDGVPPYRQFDRPSHGGTGGRGRSDALRSDGYRPVRPGDGYGSTGPNGPNGPSSPYPYPQQPRGKPAKPVNTPPYGEPYGYGNPADQDGPRRANGGWSPGQADGNGGGSSGSRPAYPPVNGHRGPYDPRGYDRRLTNLPGSRAH